MEPKFLQTMLSAVNVAMIVASEWYREYADAKGKASVQYVEMDADQADQVEEKVYDSD